MVTQLAAPTAPLMSICSRANVPLSRTRTRLVAECPLPCAYAPERSEEKSIYLKNPVPLVVRS